MRLTKKISLIIVSLLASSAIITTCFTRTNAWKFITT